MAHVAEHVPGFYGRINVGLRTAYATTYETQHDELLEVRLTWFGAVPRIFEKMYGRLHEEVAKANPTDGTRMVAAIASRELGEPVNR